ncbi:MAG: hypothetical protein Kow0040_01900 [Thermogutta sp.]
MENKLALRPRDAARVLSVSQRTLWTWTKEGRIPCVRVGRALLYPMDELRRWLAEQAGQSQETEAG